MRLLDEAQDKALSRVTLYLTQSEAAEMRDSLELLLREPRGNHAHVSSSDYEKEITICVYDEARLGDQGLSERSIRLIQRDV